jgi:hypothetical protein
MVVNIEDAGFEIRDQIMWLYASGFPKSLNIQKQFEKNGYKICECSEQNTEYDLRQMPEANISQTINLENEQGKALLSQLPQQDIQSVQQMACDERREQSGVERWSNTIQEEGQLQRNNIQESTRTTKTDGEKGWLYNGTQVNNGSNGEQIIDENRSGSSQRPQPEQQPSKQSGTMADKRGPQESGSRKICGRCGEQVVNVKGFGTALKPANEPICVARKPLSEKSVAENVLKWGTGGINVDGCRVGTETIMTNMKNTKGGLYNLGNEDRTNEVENTFNEGRFPANIILECICDEVIKGDKGEIKSTNRARKYEAGGGKFGITKDKSVEGIDNYNDKGDIHTNPMCPCYLMDEQSGVSKSVPDTRKVKNNVKGVTNFGQGKLTSHSDKGGASRFFYQAKVSKAERNMGLDEFEEVKIKTNISGLDDKPREDGSIRETPSKKNTHPTVKPVALMSYLVRLVTPPNGIVLDPFMGSGSTGIAAQLEGFRFVGMEMDADYFKIAEARIENFEEYRKFIKYYDKLR